MAVVPVRFWSRSDRHAAAGSSEPVLTLPIPQKGRHKSRMMSALGQVVAAEAEAALHEVRKAGRDRCLRWFEIPMVQGDVEQ